MKALIVFVLFVQAVRGFGVTVISPASIADNYLVGPFPGLQPQNFNVSGKIVAADPLDACTELTNADEMAGNIAIINEDICSPETKIRVLLKANARGMIYITFGGLHGSYYPTHNGDFPEDLYFPSVAISYTDGHTILDVVEEPQDVYVLLEPADGNPSQEWIDGPGGVIFQVSLELYGAASLGLAIWKLYGFILFERGIKLTVTQSCLSLEIIAILIRMVYLIDPINFHGWYSHLASASLVNTSTPFTFTATLMMSFYWLEMLTNWSRSASKLLGNVSRLKIPFAITAVILFASQIIGMILAGVNISIPSLTTINTVIVFMVAMAVAIFFIVNGVKILRTLAGVSTEEKANARWKRLSRITILLISTGASFIMFAMFLLSLVSPIAQGTIQGTLFSWWMVFALLNTVGITQVIAFQVPKKHAMERSYSYQQSREVSTHMEDVSTQHYKTSEETIEDDKSHSEDSNSNHQK